MNLRNWRTILSHAGIAYAAIVLSIVGISISTDEPVISKKAAEHASPTDRAPAEDAAGKKAPTRS